MHIMKRQASSNDALTPKQAICFSQGCDEASIHLLCKKNPYCGVSPRCSETSVVSTSLRLPPSMHILDPRSTLRGVRHHCTAWKTELQVHNMSTTVGKITCFMYMSCCDGSQSLRMMTQLALVGTHAHSCPFMH